MTLWAIVAALVAAFCYAAGAAWQQRQAVAAPTRRVVHPGLIWQLLRSPAWLAGFAVVSAGEVLHVLALAWAPLAVVQPIGVATVLFALPIGAVLGRRRPRPALLAAAALTVTSLAMLLGGMHLTETAPALTTAGLLWLAAGVAVGVGGLAVVALRASGAVRTLLLGCAAGAAFGVSAALVRLICHQVAVDGVSGLLAWMTPLLAVTAIGGLLLEQGAYKSGHLGVAITGTTITDPLVAVLVGACVLHQPVRFAHPALAVVTAVALVVGVAMLARSTESGGRRAAVGTHGRVGADLHASAPSSSYPTATAVENHRNGEVWPAKIGALARDSGR